MTYDPGRIIPGLTCPNCGFVGLLKIVSGGVTCNQCSLIGLYDGPRPDWFKPGYPRNAGSLRLVEEPTSDFPT